MFKVITPKFIKQLDAFLLVNHPVLWMSKIHYAIWHGAILWIFSGLLGYILPVNLKRNVEYELWYFLFTVLGIVILCFWVYQYLIFNKEKNYGTRKFSEEYKNFILVFITVAIFLLLPWPFEMVYSGRIKKMYSDSEVLRDINTVNERDPYLANSTNNYYSWYDSITKIQYFNIRQLNPYAASYYTPYYMKTDSAKYPELLTDFSLYRKYKPITDVKTLTQKITEFMEVAKKYDCPVNDDAQTVSKKYLALLARDKIATSEFYGYGNYQYELNTTFNNLCEVKFKTFFIFTSNYLWTMFYFVISITAFLMLFKITYWQQFLIMLVVLLLYPLVMFIFSQLMPYSNYMRGAGFFETSLLALILFSGVSLFITVKNNQLFRPVYNIFNQLFYVTLMFFPMLLIAFLHDNTNLFHNYSYLEYNGNYSQHVTSYTSQYQSQLEIAYYNYWAGEYNRWIRIMKYSGIAAFIIALPFFKSLFIKQVSLPEKY